MRPPIIQIPLPVRPGELIGIAPVPYPTPAFPQPHIGSIIINPEIAKTLLTLDSNYKEMIKQAIDTSIKFILKPVIERSVTISLYTTREIVLKDFSQEPSERKLFEAINMMIQCLAGSLAIVTCKEPLRMDMVVRIREILSSRNGTELSVKQIEQIAQTITKDNLDIGSSYIQQSVIQKSKQRVREDQAIREAIEKRKAANAAKVKFSGSIVVPEKVPASIWPQTVGITNPEMEVYRQFINVLKENIIVCPTELHEEKNKSAYKIFQSLPAIHAMIENGTYIHPEVVNNTLKKFQLDLQETEVNPKVLDQIVREIFQSCIKHARFLSDKNEREKCMIYIQLLSILCTYNKALTQRITELTFKECEDELKYNYEWISALFKVSLFDIPSYDIELSRALHNLPSLPPAVSSVLLSFVALLVTELMLAEKLLQPANFPNTFMAMNQIHKTPKAQENAEFARMLAELEPQAKDFRIATLKLLEEWVAFSQDQSAEQVRNYFDKLTAHLAGGDDKCINFFSIIAEVAVQQALFSSHSANGLVANFPDRPDFRIVDSVLKLLFTMMKGKMVLGVKSFQCFIQSLTSLLQNDHNSKLFQFNQRPYYRFFVMLIQSLSKAEYSQQVHSDLLQIIANALHEVNPRFCPGFAFAWFDLVTHRNFLPHLISRRHDERHPDPSDRMALLLCDMFKFLKLILGPGEPLHYTANTYFGAVMRTTLVLFHDFPDFLTSHYFDFLYAIPEQCTQLRNIILSAIPLGIKAPEPKRGIKVDKLPEQQAPPFFISDFKNILKYRNIIEDIDKYMATKNPSLLIDICNKLLSPDPQFHNKRPEVEIYHALILYMAELSLAVIDQAEEKLDITFTLLNILSKLDLLGRDCLLNAVFNEIRYPSSYTHYFHMFLLHLMRESVLPMIQEQILRILLERQLIQAPYPWGLKILFCELQQNPIYDIASKPFVKAFKEVANIFVPLKEKP